MQIYRDVSSFFLLSSVSAAKKISEYIAEVQVFPLSTGRIAATLSGKTGKIKTTKTFARVSTALTGAGRSEHIILLSFFIVAEHGIRFTRLLEFLRRGIVFLIFIRVVLMREFSERFLYFFFFSPFFFFFVLWFFFWVWVFFFFFRPRGGGGPVFFFSFLGPPPSAGM